MKNIFCKIVLLWLFLLVTMPSALAKTIMYVPFDDRPVSLEYPVDTVKAANFDILVPPTEYLASRERSGDPVKLWEWVLENASKADAIVLSADALLYGGLVDSRTHDLSSIVLEWRLKHFNTLKEINPKAPLYIFSTIMRSPHASAGGVEPPYYDKYGPQIFQLTALQDKAEVKGLSAEEELLLQTTQTEIPKEYLADWMNRRDKNLTINAKLIELTKAGTFNYLIMGRDDTSPFSQSHKESRTLNRIAEGLTDSKYGTFPGADQLGMVLLARAYNHLTSQTPIVEIEYALGAGASTVASYEDQPIGRTIKDHILAAGGNILQKSQKPDLVLAVNTPLFARTDEAEVFDNLAIDTYGTSRLVSTVENQIKAGTPVAVVDIAFANGADNSLMKALFEKGLLDKLKAYSGWNTASNTLGYAIGQGMMAQSMAEQDRKHLLAIRYLDDWAYQANIRKELLREGLDPRIGDDTHLDGLETDLTVAVEKEMRRFAERYLWVRPEQIKVSFPWNRMFEIRVVIEQ